MLNYASVMCSCNHTVLSELLLLVTFGQLSDGRHITPPSPWSRLLIQLSCINILLLLPGEGWGGSINRDPITVFCFGSLSLCHHTNTTSLFGVRDGACVWVRLITVCPSNLHITLRLSLTATTSCCTDTEVADETSNIWCLVP